MLKLNDFFFYFDGMGFIIWTGKAEVAVQAAESEAPLFLIYSEITAAAFSWSTLGNSKMIKRGYKG